MGIDRAGRHEPEPRASLGQQPRKRVGLRHRRAALQMHMVAQCHPARRPALHPGLPPGQPVAHPAHRACTLPHATGHPEGDRHLRARKPDQLPRRHNRHLRSRRPVVTQAAGIGHALHRTRQHQRHAASGASPGERELGKDRRTIKGTPRGMRKPLAKQRCLTDRPRRLLLDRVAEGRVANHQFKVGGPGRKLGKRIAADNPAGDRTPIHPARPATQHEPRPRHSRRHRVHLKPQAVHLRARGRGFPGRHKQLPGSTGGVGTAEQPGRPARPARTGNQLLRRGGRRVVDAELPTGRLRAHTATHPRLVEPAHLRIAHGRDRLPGKPGLPKLAERRCSQRRNLRPLQTCSYRKTGHQPPALARLLFCGPADAVLQADSYPGSRSILAPSARSLSSIRSYPRSMCRTL